MDSDECNIEVDVGEKVNIDIVNDLPVEINTMEEKVDTLESSSEIGEEMVKGNLIIKRTEEDDDKKSQKKNQDETSQINTEVDIKSEESSASVEHDNLVEEDRMNKSNIQNYWYGTYYLFSTLDTMLTYIGYTKDEQN